MGVSWIQFYRQKIKWQWKLAFLSTFLMGLLIHFYKFTNTLRNHDSLFNFYSDQNVLGSGRWFLSIACGFSSYFDLPWINGIFSIALIAFTAVVIIDLFRVENPVLIGIIGGLIVAFPAVTETMFFEFTADGYMLAMLLAALAVRCSTFERCGFSGMAVSAVLICLSCGIYQAYVSFALLLDLCYFVNELLEDRQTDREYLCYIGKKIGIYVSGLILYFVIWKACMAIQGVIPNNYQGISEVSSLKGMEISGAWIIHGIKNCIKTIMLFFFEWNIIEHEITPYGILNMVFIVAFCAGLLGAFYKSGLFTRKKHLVLALFSLLLCIPCAGMWHFASESVGYRPMMLQSLSILYIFMAILFNRWYKEHLSNIVALLLIVIILNDGIIANIGYFYMERCSLQSYATGLEMMLRIRDIREKTNFDQIAIVGSRASDVSLGVEGESTRIHMMAQLLESDLLYDGRHAQLYLENVFDVDIPFLSTEECKEFESYKEIAEMEQWPASGAMKVINDTLVIRIGDISEEGE